MYSKLQYTANSNVPKSASRWNTAISLMALVLIPWWQTLKDFNKPSPRIIKRTKERFFCLFVLAAYRWSPLFLIWNIALGCFLNVFLLFFKSTLAYFLQILAPLPSRSKCTLNVVDLDASITDTLIRRY